MIRLRVTCPRFDEADQKVHTRLDLEVDRMPIGKFLALLEIVATCEACGSKTVVEKGI